MTQRTFPFTVAEYISCLNRNLAQSAIKNGHPFAAAITRPTDDGKSLHMGMINEHLGLVIYESLDGRVTSVFFSGQGDGSSESGTDVIVATLAAIRAANQTSAPEKRTGRLTLDLIKTNQEVIVQDGIEYRPGMNPSGFILTIAPTSVPTREFNVPARTDPDRKIPDPLFIKPIISRELSREGY